MHYDGMIIRPPSEADSILLQVTLGCSHNKCTFCGSFREKRFAIKKRRHHFSGYRVCQNPSYPAKKAVHL